MRGLIDTPHVLERKDSEGNVIWSQEAYSFLDDYEEGLSSLKVEGDRDLLFLPAEKMNQFEIAGINPFHIIEP